MSRRIGLRSITRLPLLATLLLGGVWVSAAALPAAGPDLTPYAPPGYQYPVVPNSVKNTTTGDTTLYAGKDTFYDWHFINAGDASAGVDFHVEVRVDGVAFIRYPYEDWFGAGAVGGFDDWSHGVADTGPHTVTIVVDPDNVVAESDESNNTWQMVFQWLPVNGWWAEYFNNMTLSGDPVLVRSEFIDFEWPGSPGPGVNADAFSVRWTRVLDLSQPTQRFTLTRDNGMRLYMDGNLIYNEWSDTVDEDTFVVDTGIGPRSMRLEMFEAGGTATARLVRLPCFPLDLSVAPTGSGSITADPPPNCGPDKYVKTDVTLEAVANPGFSFDHWSGDLSGATNPAVIQTSMEAKNIVAHFATTACYTLTTVVNPAGGGTISVNPPSNCAGGKYTAGTSVTVTAAANSGYTFANWSGDVSGPQLSRTVTMNGDRSVTANFNANVVCYALTTAVNPAGSGTVDASPPPNCAGGKYTAGTSVSLSAAANSGYTFANWSGDLSGAASPQSVTMNGNRAVTANFAPLCYSLLTSVNPAGSGTVNASPPPNCAGGLYTAGTSVSLTATPLGSYTFANWSGDLGGAANPQSVTMNGNRAVTAHFITSGTDCYPLALNHTGQGADPTAAPAQSPGCDAGSYKAGTTVQLTAAPASGWHVGGWAGTANDASTATSNSLTTTAAGRSAEVHYVRAQTNSQAVLPFILYAAFVGPREVEPNDIPEEANGPLLLNRDYQGYPNDRSDYYFFELTASRQVTITLDDVTGQDPQLQLRDAANQLVGDIDARPPYSLSHTLPPGRYYVRVAVVAGNNSTTLYTLRVSAP